ncbi:hypothetical protein K9L05_00875, partial [Candidatus Babeliales bacterium]|nr:hypothetical protein [Candidatus Babeliales bacterium]
MVKKLYIYIALIIFFNNLFSAPTIYDTTQTLGVAATIKDFYWYRDGFQVSTMATIAIPEPVGCIGGDFSAGVDLNAGVLNLSSDLYLGAGTFIKAGSGNGLIFGEGNSFIFGGDVQLADSSPNVIVTYNLVINGGGYSLDFNGQSLVVYPDGLLSLKNTTLKNFTTDSIIVGEDATSFLYLDNVTIELTGDFDLSTGGEINITGVVCVKGNGHTFSLTAGTISMAENSVLYFDNGTTFKINGGTFTPDASSTLFFDSCTVDVSVADLTVGSGSVLFENKVAVKGSGTSG